MPKKKKQKAYNMDDEMIIGYNVGSKKKRTSQRKQKRKKNKIKKILLVILKIILILAIIVGIILFLFVSPVFNITNIRVEGAEKISQNTYIVLSKIQIRRKHI